MVMQRGVAVNFVDFSLLFSLPFFSRICAIFDPLQLKGDSLAVATGGENEGKSKWAASYVITM